MNGSFVKGSTDVGEFLAPRGVRPCSSGDPMTIVVSADVVALSTADDGSGNRVIGQVRGEEFIGSVITLFLELADGSVFRVQKQQHEIARLQVQFGSKVSASWGAESNIHSAELIRYRGGTLASIGR